MKLEKQLEFGFMEEVHKAERNENIKYGLRAVVKGTVIAFGGVCLVGGITVTYSCIKYGFEKGLKLFGEGFLNF